MTELQPSINNSLHVLFARIECASVCVYECLRINCILKNNSLCSISHILLSLP
jgi:hypothetical protein